MSNSQPPVRIVPVSDVSDPWGPDLEAPTPRRSGAELLREAILVLPNLVKLTKRCPSSLKLLMPGSLNLRRWQRYRKHQWLKSICPPTRRKPNRSWKSSRPRN